MAKDDAKDNESVKPDSDGSIKAPSLSLPKGGGAIRGIGEKFAANPVTGTASMTVPIATSPGRSGFGPQLSLAYDSGAGNGPFGIGWSLSLPSITRKTDKGLPQYVDSAESDVFILSGSEDLVPAFRKDSANRLVLDHDGIPVNDEESRDGFLIKRYRPRIEGLFSVIERWTRLSDGDMHWRSISKDNILTVYGATVESRIVDPADPRRVFSWLICQSYDDKGNAIVYDFAAENDDNIDFSRGNERNRIRSANRYLKSIRYGNRRPLLIDPARPSFRQPHVPAPDFGSAGWMFEVVLDYGEGHYHQMPPDADGRIFATATVAFPAGGKWPARLDPFSAYRSGFEVRSYRLCRRVLMFHHFPDELSVNDYLVRSTEFIYDERTNGTFISSVTQSGFKLITSPSPRYLKRSLPPLDFEYTASPLDDGTYRELALQEADPASVENIPAGIDGSNYRWIDLDGEGISGVLSEQGGSWFYKANLGNGLFAPVQEMSPRPSLAALGRGRQQFLDLAGDGNLDLVEFGGATPGFFPRTDDAGWDDFRPFPGLPAIDWQDANLRLVDLTGDGHADILVTEDQAYCRWYESRAEEGFGDASRTPFPFDEEEGPYLVFADGTQSVYLADMSGDGLSDLVRIRTGEVCYWPNLGYGRFGAKVAMDNAPTFDDQECFDHRRLHLTDTDGSGPTDILYLGRDGVRVYLNEHGNSLSDARLLSQVPPADNLTSVSVVDLLGRGTACLLWSSPLPAESLRPVRYLDLMAGVKPHLLKKVANNLGAETKVEYRSSTEFYLADKAAGTPWATRLPFPVHVVTRVESNDLISGNRFVTSHSYHHGYFDGPEREFRGFGRVEQKDTEEFGVIDPSGAPATNLAEAFYVPPTLTKTWFHTGAFLAGARVSRHLEDEYYREGDSARPGSGLSREQLEAMLLDDTVLPPDLPLAEVREAIRSLKGAILRQEVYGLDGTEEADRPYSVSERNYTIEPVQPRGGNRHSVFFTHARETIDFHYERKLFAVVDGKVVDAATAAGNPDVRWLADPRVTHNMTLAVDDYGNVRQSLAIAYGRRFEDADPVLTDEDRKKQKQLLLTVADATFTNPVLAADAYRAPLPAQVATYELIRFADAYAEAAGKTGEPAPPPGVTPLLRFGVVQAMLAAPNDGAIDLPYEDVNAAGAVSPVLYRRLIECVRTLYRSNDLAEILPLAAMEALGLRGEIYKVALTPGLLAAVFRRRGAPLLPEPAAILAAASTASSDHGGYVDLDGDGRWWIPSTRAFYHLNNDATPADELTEAVAHFFQPRRFRGPFGESTYVDYANDLLAVSTRDAVGNAVEAIHDFRVLKARQLTDPNGNRSFAAFDGLGLTVATAVSGKIGENVGDSLDLTDSDADPALQRLLSFVSNPGEEAAAMLKGATTRFVYDLDRFRRCSEPPFAATLVRETHVSDPLPPQGQRIQVTFTYSDGFGRELLWKIPAEPGDAPTRSGTITLPSGDIVLGALVIDSNGNLVPGRADPRWVGKGRTIFNNKGKPVRQYEPFFSSSHLYEREPEMTETGVSKVLFYDPAERVVTTLRPNHTYEKVVFHPWRQESWDTNDTVTLDPRTDPDAGPYLAGLPDKEYLPTWFQQRKDGGKGPEEKAAADKAAIHAGTPKAVVFDPLGRTMLHLDNNGKDASGNENICRTATALDIEGNQRQIIDALDRVVMQYDYDMAGSRIHQSSMEAGERWMLNDVTGKPVRAWNARLYDFRYEYDQLRRPLRSFVLGGDPDEPDAEVLRQEILFERTVYGDSDETGLTEAQRVQGNLRGRAYAHYDNAGILTNEYDFKGNRVRSRLQFASDYKAPPDWSQGRALDADIFTTTTVYDALNRAVAITAPDGSVHRPSFNEANLLDKVEVNLRGVSDPTPFVTNIDYNAKGQRTSIRYANGAETSYGYDPETFRVVKVTTTRTPPSEPASQLFNDAAIVQDISYFYDTVGNITRAADAALRSVFNSNQRVDAAADYTYDPLYRLTAATGREHVFQTAFRLLPADGDYRDYPFAGAGALAPQPNNLQAMRNYAERYDYDAVGNFLSVTHRADNGDWSRAYSYQEDSLIEQGKKSNRLSQTTLQNGTPAPPAESYLYNAHGSQTRMPHLPVMRWSFMDRLAATSRQVVNGGTPETTFYVYDASGQRACKVTERQNGTRKSQRFYLGGFEIYREYDGSGKIVTLQRESMHVMDDTRRLALVESVTSQNGAAPRAPVTTERYQIGNPAGSVTLELDSAGGLISYEEYFPYGGTSFQAGRSAAEVSLKRYRYIGKERDGETGFSYHGARYYAPWLGRWTACDPTGPVDEENLYRYGRSNPVVFVDPNGRQSNSLTSSAVTHLDMPTDRSPSPEELDDLLVQEAHEGGTLRLAPQPKARDMTEAVEAIGPQHRPDFEIARARNAPPAGETPAGLRGTKNIAMGVGLVALGIAALPEGGGALALAGYSMLIAGGAAQAGVGAVQLAAPMSRKDAAELDRAMNFTLALSSPGGLGAGSLTAAFGGNPEQVEHAAFLGSMAEGLSSTALFKPDYSKLYSGIPLVRIRYTEKMASDPQTANFLRVSAAWAQAELGALTRNTRLAGDANLRRLARREQEALGYDLTYLDAMHPLDSAANPFIAGGDVGTTYYFGSRSVNRSFGGQLGNELRRLNIPIGGKYRLELVGFPDLTLHPPIAPLASSPNLKR